MNELISKNLKELIDIVERGEVSSNELYRTFYGRIEDKDKEINSFITKIENLSLTENSKFRGIPIAIKDNIITKGRNTTSAS